jgi:hypothetical protein
MFERFKTRVEHLFGNSVRTPYAVLMPHRTSEATDNGIDDATDSAPVRAAYGL